MVTPQRIRKRKRGVAVLIAIFFMILLSLIGVALIGMVPVELRSSTRTKLDLQAHYAVTSGIRHARSWCSAVMTPADGAGSPDFLGDDSTTTGNSFYDAGGSYLNEVTGINPSAAGVEYAPMRLSDVFNSGPIPKANARWNNVYQMLNIPESGDTKVDDQTVVVVKKAPLDLGEWQVYTVIIPDADTPGGINTQTSGKINAQFGGAGKSGRRAYQMISIAFYQGFPTLRGKSTVLEDSFARYSLFVDNDASSGWFLQGLPNQISTLGPVHTNGTFRFAIDSGVWSTSANATVPFNGLLTFARSATATEDGIVASLNPDGVVYGDGNEQANASENHRPFNSAGNEIGNRYSKMIAGGRSNLRQVSKVGLPPDSTKLANAAYGPTFTTAPYNATAMASHLTTDSGAPDGIFVFENAGKPSGGVVLKGDQQNVFLEVVDLQGKPVGVDQVNASGTIVATGNLAVLETQSTGATPPGNPAIRAQAKTAQTAYSTVSSLSTRIIPATTNSQVTPSTTGSRVFTTTIGSGSTSYYFTPSTSRSTQYFTSMAPTTSVGTSTISTRWSTWVTTSTNYSYSTQTTYFSSVTTAGGAGGVRQTVTYSTRYNTITSTFSTPRTTSSITGYVTTVTTSRGSTRTTTSSTVHLIPTSRQTSTVIRSSTSHLTTTYDVTNVTNYSTIPAQTSSSWVTNVESETYRPIDQMIEARNMGVQLSPTMFAANGTANYQRAAGSRGSGSDMDVSKLAGITALLDRSGNPLSATTVPKDNIVIIKQSRHNPKEAVVIVVPATPNSEGSLLNGAVLSEGHIGDPGNPGSNQRGRGGISGVNYGRKTIGTHIKANDPDLANDTNLFGKQPQAESTSVGIVNNLWQVGTAMRETSTAALRADNGLGIVSQDVRVNARGNDFTNFWSGNNPNYATDNILNIHAVIMGGSQADGGLTVNGFTELNKITPGNLGTGANHTPIMRFVGGLILRNYYDRINASTGAGWNSKNIYNQQLALKPPPYFPNNGLLLPLSYVEERIWSDQRR